MGVQKSCSSHLAFSIWRFGELLSANCQVRFRERNSLGLRRLFKKEKQEHRILREAVERSGQLVPEYHRATPECPHPEHWSMYDSMTAEYEVLEFLRTLVTTVKPDLVVETGTFLGVSTQWIAEACELQRLRPRRQLRIRSRRLRRRRRKKIDASEFRDLHRPAQ